MKTAIVYYSQHHRNTKKLLDAIADKNEVTLIDTTQERSADLSQYDKIGFASGIYYSKYAKQVLAFAKENLPEGKAVFFIITAGSPRDAHFNSIRRITKEKNCKEIGTFKCLGFDTFGPFKLVGGLQKGHPTEEEIEGAVRFYESL